MPLTESAITGFSLPWVGAAVAGGSVVVALHLWNRGAGARVLFPATALLHAQNAAAESRRRRRPRRWPLIIVRALVVMLALLAFDRPVLTSPSRTVAGERVVVIVDVSASMGMPEGGVTRLDRAKERVRALVSDLDLARTPTMLMLSGERTIDASGGFAQNRAAIERALREADVMMEEDDLQSGMQRGIDALRGNPGVIHVVSDMQHPPALSSVPEHARVELHGVATDAATQNTGVVDLSWSPRFPFVGDTLRVNAAVRRLLPARDTQDITISFGGSTQRVPIAFDAEGTGQADAVFEVTSAFDDELVTVASRVSPDLFTDDDERTGAVLVRTRCDVSVIGAPGQVIDALAPPGVSTPYRVGREIEIQDADAIVVVPSEPLGVAREDALVEAHGRGVPMLWLIDNADGSDALASFASLIGGRVISTEQDHEAGGGVLLTALGERVLPDLSASRLLEDSVAARREYAFAYPSLLQPLMLSASGTPVALHAGTLGVIDLGAFDALSPPMYVVLLHELLNTLVQQAPLVERPVVFPARESDPVQPLSSDDDAREASTPATRSVQETPLGAYLAFCALLLLAIEPLVYRFSTRGTA